MQETRSKISIGCPGFPRTQEAALQTGMEITARPLQEFILCGYSSSCQLKYYRAKKKLNVNMMQKWCCLLSFKME